MIRDGEIMHSTDSKRLAWVSVALLVLAIVSGCGGPQPEGSREGMAGTPEPVPLAPGARLKVVATTNIVGDVVRNLGGDQIELTTLMGVGVDPHTYVPTPADTVAVHNAHVLFANGAGLEANLDRMLASAGGQAVRVYLSEGLELRPAVEHQAEEAGHEEEHEHGDFDPHVWFDVQNVIRWTQTVEQTLSALDPDHAAIYQANATAYIGELEALDTWIAEQIATIPPGNRRLVTNHPAFGYFAARYGLEQIGAVYPVSPSAEPSAQDIAALEEAIRRYQVPAVFSESSVNPKLAQQVAHDTGIRLVMLYTGSLGGPGSGAESYIALMRYDVQAMVEALK